MRRCLLALSDLAEAQGLDISVDVLGRFDRVALPNVVDVWGRRTPSAARSSARSSAVAGRRWHCGASLTGGSFSLPSTAAAGRPGRVSLLAASVGSGRALRLVDPPAPAPPARPMRLPLRARRVVLASPSPDSAHTQDRGHRRLRALDAALLRSCPKTCERSVASSPWLSPRAGVPSLPSPPGSPATFPRSPSGSRQPWSSCPAPRASTTTALSIVRSRFRSGQINASLEVVCLESELDPRQVAAILRAAELTVGMRLHACVIAYAQRCPFLGLAYHPKIAAFTSTVGCGRSLLPRNPPPQQTKSAYGYSFAASGLLEMNLEAAALEAISSAQWDKLADLRQSHPPSLPRLHRSLDCTGTFTASWEIHLAHHIRFTLGGTGRWRTRRG